MVLNGTSIDGLASRERDTLIQAGYADGMIRIDNSDDQARQDSLVLYSEDERRQARDVARLLDISRIEAIDEETQALADSSDETGTLPADIVVVLGTDKAPVGDDPRASGLRAARRRDVRGVLRRPARSRASPRWRRS